jgi:hypothetical protein
MGFGSFWNTYYGNERVDFGALAFDYCATGQVFGCNPPYALSDFLAVYPKFFGAPTAVTGTTVAPAVTSTAITQNSTIATVASAAGISNGWVVSGIGITPGTTCTISGLTVTFSQPALTNATTVLTFSDPVGSIQITGLSSIAGMALGQLIVGTNLAPGTLIVSATGTTATLSRPVIASGSSSFQFYPAPFMPIVAIQLYLNLAQASLMQARWLDSWTLGMALFIAHYCTLYLRTESGPNLTAQQIATSGLQKGITVSKAVGDVSTSAQLIDAFEGWGSFAETEYGGLLITMAQGIAMGPIWVG